jgi:hypothetical protein
VQKSNIPHTAPHFREVHAVTVFLTLVSGTISALAASYHIYAAATFSVAEVKLAFVILGGVFALTMALTPMFLARPHGEAIEGGNAQSGLMLIVLMVMALDGALQVHAASVIMEALDIPLPAWWIMAIGAALFQLSMFFMRGTLFACSREIQDMIDARQHDLDMAAAYAREQQLAKRREDYAAKRGNVLSMERKG